VHGKATGEEYLCFPMHYCSCHAFFFDIVHKGEAIYVSSPFSPSTHTLYYIIINIIISITNIIIDTIIIIIINITINIVNMLMPVN
jgi:hypothetical protein